MKRVSHLFEKLISNENLSEAIMTVARSHRWYHYPDKPNKKAAWLEATLDDRIKELREIIVSGFEPSEATKKRRYDANARKWRDIAEPKLFPDQCVHHALVQVLEPVMMRGMDNWCCGSIKKRGAHYGVKAIKKWMDKDPKGTRWCVEMDIRHFYDSLTKEQVVKSMRRLVKDYRTLDLIERVLRDGVLIGAYCSQWFANTFLQSLDHAIRESDLGVEHFIRYMDNFTIFTHGKRSAHKIVEFTKAWLLEHGLELKGNYQIFMVRQKMPKNVSSRIRMKRRLPNALGYRYGRGFILLRKHSLLRLERQLRRFYFLYESGFSISIKFAQGLISRLGMLNHCSNVAIRKKIVKKKTLKRLKNVVRRYQKEAAKWSTSLVKEAMVASV